MWIQDLLVDQFDGVDDLGLSNLSRHLNVIRLPSDAEAKQLSRFLPAILSGHVIGSAQPRGGSLLIHHGCADDAEALCDLSRVALPGTSRLSDLQVMAGDDEEDRIHAGLAPFPTPLYTALLTDNLPPLERVRVWRSSPLVKAALSIQNAPDGAAQAVSPAPWSEALETWAAMRTDAQAAVESGASGRKATSAAPPLNREDYLSARAEAASLRERVRALRSELDQVTSQQQAAARASALAEQVREHRARQQQIPRGPDRAPAPALVHRVEQLDCQLDSLRAQLRDLQPARAELSPRPPRDARHNLDRMQAVLDRWPICQQQLAELRTLRRATHSPPPADTAVEDPRALADALHKLRRAAEDYRAEAAAPALAPSPTPDAEPAPWTDDDASMQIAALRRQIRQLRDESRQLLARQLLSRQALLGIGVMFATGVAILLAALFLNLGDAAMSTGAIGLTCVIASALLKVSFERAPSREIHQQRLRIAHLLREIESLNRHAPADEPFSEGSSHAGPPQPAVPAPQPSSSSWQATLADLDLPPQLTPAAAFAAVRRRAARRASAEATHDPQPPRDGRATELQAAVEDWCRQAADCLSRPTRLTSTDFERARAWRAKLQAACLWEEEQLRTAEQQAADATERKQQQAELQTQIKHAKRERRQLLRKARAESLDDLKARQQAQAEQSQRIQEADQQRREIERRVAADPEPDRVRALLERAEELDDICVQLEATRSERQTELSQAQRQLKQVRRKVERGALEPPRVPSPPASAKWSESASVAVDLVGAVLASQRDQTAAPKEGAEPTASLPTGSPAMELATAWLRKISAQDRWSLTWPDRDAPLQLTVDDEVLELERLDPPTQHLVVLAVQLALVECVTASTERLPLVLRDASLRHDSATCQRIAAVLTQLAQSQQQILLITTREAVTQLFHAQGVPSLVVSRQVARPADAAPREPILVSRETTDRDPTRRTATGRDTQVAATDQSLASETLVEYERSAPALLEDHAERPGRKQASWVDAALADEA